MGRKKITTKKVLPPTLSLAKDKSLSYCDKAQALAASSRQKQFFWSYLSGLYDADGHIYKSTTGRCTITIAGDLNQLRHFLWLGTKIGQPFSLTRGPGKALLIV